ncbi:MAG: SRPBCC domain-containing protein [Acidimicrobiia bacterium]|nr:SRPBCC domain-containing protein [Acidimicrobiia bacterium]
MTQPNTTTTTGTTSVTADGAIVLTERVHASPEEVFEFLVDPEKMIRWMGTAVDIEPTPGGKFWLNATGTDIASGTYLEVDPPRRVVFTWGWEGASEVPPGSSTVTITLTGDGDDTTVELRHEGLPGGADDQHVEGWSYFLPRLAAVAAGNDPGTNMHASG